MWEQLERYRNHYLQHEIKFGMSARVINHQQEKDWQVFIDKRDRCKKFPHGCPGSSTYFDDRAQLAYVALPKLMRELNSDDNTTHWRAAVSLSELLLNPLHVQCAINEMDIVRKLGNAFMRVRRRFNEEQHKELEIYLTIYNILSRNLKGAQQIAGRKCLMVELYKILQELDPVKENLAAVILRNLTGNPDVLYKVLEDAENFAAVANIFKKDTCKPYYPADLWYHLCDLLEVAPEQGIQLGLFEVFHARILQRLPLYWDMTTKAFALMLRCAEGQKRFDAVDGVKLIYEALQPVAERQPANYVTTFEFLMLALVNGLHSKLALWRCREFTSLPCYVGRLMSTELNPKLQLYCMQAFRELGVMPCIKRYIIGNWLDDISKLFCLNAEVECARDELLDWLRRDIADSS